MELKKGESLVLPDWLRPALAGKFGDILSEEEVTERLKNSKTNIISIGDQVTATLLRHGIEPNLAIFDLKIHREPVKNSKLPGHYKDRLRVKNPQKEITYELWYAISKSINKKKKAIQVDGEEDLSAMVCGYLADEGTVVLYGMPNTGISFVLIDKDIKSKIEKLLNQMEIKPVT
jgi:hypothetical protein